ncbi:hypothetical protein DSO57_1039339 [Entomophthora muscae]|uniref:Uncharacterized protein n=1 Tax=Entomophthora muscae TaxID=34485 RepID=A0ACC2UK25_9FUNG|nr:hypothetical protein DSO57_1039339 [Entomophthora muscae]
MNQYLSTQTLPNQPIKSLKDIITFNSNNPSLYPEMDMEPLNLSHHAPTITHPHYTSNVTETRSVAKTIIDEFMESHQIHALVALSDPSLFSQVLPCLADYPIVTIPLGIAKDGSPFGVSIYSSWGQEDIIFSIAQAIDPHSKFRHSPQFLKS